MALTTVNDYVERAKLEKFAAAPKIIEFEALSRLELLSVMISAMSAQARYEAA